MTAITQDQRPSFDDCVMRYELALRDRDVSEWYELTIEAIDAVQAHCVKRGLTESGIPKKVREHWYTRLATALTRFITSPSAALTLQQLSAVCRRKQIIAYIFSASGYRNMQHLVPLLGHHNGGEITIPKEQVVVIYAFIGLDDVSHELMDLALKQEPQVLLTLMLGWLNQRAILTEQGERNRGLLLQSGSLIEPAVITDSHIEQIVNAWMYSSYATSPRKHDIKASFNVLLAKLMNDAGISSLQTNRVDRQRPTIVVIHERFVKQHAMYRCYATSLRSLKVKFKLIAIAETEWIDDASDDIFDEIIKLEKGSKKLNALVKMVQGLEPDIVYYPSLGMNHWTVMLAQLRLAPIQVMSHGHPGTSMSPMVDYAYTCELDGDLGAIHSEKVLVGSEYGAFVAHSDLPQRLPKLIEASDREVRIAVNSKVMKLSHRLLDICERLVSDAAVPVRFFFFPGERGLYFDGLVEAITSRLPGATVLPYCTYGDFLEAMCKCDLALAAFPFGNTNSTVDTCLLGLPTVANFGPESPAQSDKMVLATAGFPDWLVAKTDEEYYEKALSLINDADLRKSVVKGVTRSKVRERLFNAAAFDEERDSFADMFWYVYKNHEILQSASQRVFHYKNLRPSVP